jgi:drug/metabolite transporter (DMT)-like permease
MSVLTYSLALYAYRMADVPRLSALRETSILFATAIAVFILKEKLTLGRFAGIAGIATGAAVLLVSG